MKQPVKQLFVLLLMAVLMSNTVWASESLEHPFMLHSSSKSMAEVVSAIKSYAKKKHWMYLGDYKVKHGEVILVKFCVKDAGKIAWRAGLKVSAMLPCGNVGVYRENGKTELSMLNPYYMDAVYPDLDLESAADLLMPLYKEMLVSVTK